MMSKQIQAVYERGVIRPLEPVALTEGEELDVVLLPRRKEQHEAKVVAMQEAMCDQLFLADLRETMEDFRHTDAEEAPA